MKRLFLISTFIILSVFCYSQNPSNQLKDFIKDEQAWLLDSIYFYESSVNAEYQYFTRIKQRTASSLPLFKEVEQYNFTTNKYEFSYSIDYDYIVENDTNEIFEICIDDYQGTMDSTRRYTNNNDQGYAITTTEERSDNIWVDGIMHRTQHMTDPHTFHHLEYHRENENQDWKLFYEKKSYYNIDSTKIHRYRYYDIDNNPDTTEKSIYYFNENHLIYKTEDYKKNNGLWILDKKTLNTYDPNNNLILEESFIEFGGILINDNRKVIKYDINGYTSSQQIYRWNINTDNWIFQFRIDYVNDSNGNALQEIIFANLNDSLWMEGNKSINSFNNYNQIINSKQYLIDSDSNWIPTVNITTVYYNSLLISSHTFEIWDTTINDYKGSTRRECTYNENDQLTLNEFFRTHINSNNWELIFKTEITYTESENQKIIDRLSTDYPSWDTTSRYIYYYNKSTTGIPETTTHEYALYPNPAYNQIRLTTENYRSQNNKYEMINTLGQLVKSGTINIDGTIQVHELIIGQYFLRIHKPNGKAEVLKFQKK